MRLSLKNQILIPIVGIQIPAVTIITILSAQLATNRSEREIIARLNSVIGTLEEARFPYTPGVLARMRGLSGAHFALMKSDGSLAAATLPDLKSLPAPPRTSAPRPHLEALAEAPMCQVNDVRYFAVPLRPAGGVPDATMLVLYPETSWRQARWEAATPPLAMGLGTLGLMAGVTSWIAHRISRGSRRCSDRWPGSRPGTSSGSTPGPASMRSRSWPVRSTPCAAS